MDLATEETLRAMIGDRDRALHSRERRIVNLRKALSEIDKEYDHENRGASVAGSDPHDESICRCCIAAAALKADA